MKKSDFERITAALNELSLFVFECMQKEYSEQSEKALNNKRLFNFQPFPPDEREKKAIERLLSDMPGEAVAPSRNPLVDSQSNISSKNKGFSLSEKEIEKMLIEFEGMSITKKPRKDGRFQGYIYVKGEKIYVYGYSRSEVASKIKHIMKYGVTIQKKVAHVVNGVPQNFDAFATYYFEKFRKRKVSEKTYVNDLSRYKNHIKPFFRNKPLKRIIPGECQELLDRINGERKYKTAEEVHSILSVIFKCAISHGIIQRNPLDVIYVESHERQHGKALSADEITLLKESLKDTVFMQPFMILLYTGLRPNELATVRIDDKFIIAVNSKRKTKKVEYKKIPITPMLAPYLTGNIYLSSPDYLRRKIKEVLPNHILYDLRTTFYTKCKECGVAEPALNHFVGHSNGVLGNTYTDLSDTYLLSEAQKIRF